MTRKIFVSVLILFFLGVGLSETKESIKILPIKVIWDDGITVEGVDLTLIEGMGFISVGDVSKIFNTSNTWHSVSKKVTIALGTDTIEFFVDSKKVIINSKAKRMGKSTRFIEGTIMVPLEFFLTDSFGELIPGKVSWDYQKKILSIQRDYNITEIRSYTHPRYTRIVLDTSKELRYNVIKDYPDKLIVTIYHGFLEKQDDLVKINDGRVKHIDVQHDRRATKLSIYLDRLAKDYKDFQLEKPYRIVIDIVGGEVKTVSEPLIASKKSDEKSPAPETKQKSIPHVLVGIVPSKSIDVESGIKTVVIDAGHGGKDPGAVGRKGTKEKDISLDIAKRLAKMIEENSDIKVVLTRKGDYFLTLDERTRIANANKADLFISIHTNASISGRLNGFEVYFLSDKASDKEAEAVANIENSVINLETNRPKDNLSIILWSMALNEFMNESSELGSLISGEVSKIKEVKNRGVKQAGFYVLRGAKMPAVLVETAFISNSKEENKLRTRAFRERIAESIYRGIIKYKKIREK